MLKPFQIIFFLTLSLCVSPHRLNAQGQIIAPNQQAEPVNQRRAYGNACGPACLLNSFQYGNTKWQKIYQEVPGNNSRTKIQSVIKTWGNKPSSRIKGTNRWNIKQGINLLDLTDMANEMRASYFLPKIKNEVLTQKGSKADLLQHTYKRMAKSFKKGLPPIISIRRYAYRYNSTVGQHTWWPIRAHFVTVTAIPNKLPKGSQSFTIQYVDPYGGYTRQGSIRATTGQFTQSPFLIADFPKSTVGSYLLKAGEKNELSLCAMIGSW